MFNADATACDICCVLAAYCYPLFPPSEPSETMQMLSRCLQAETFDTRVDASDDLELPARARLPLRVTPVTTNGDGACAIHSVWGVPDNLSQLTCPEARRFAAEAMGESLLHLRTHIPLEFREDVHDLATSLWSEYMVGYFEGQRSPEIQSFKQHLQRLHPDLLREAQACFNRRAVIKQDMDACEVLMKQQCKRVCIRSLEEHVIRPMAAHLRTIPRNCDVLAMSAADLEALRRQHPREYDYLGTARSESKHMKGTRSELFPMDGPMSKYHSLFDHRPGFDALRWSFWNSSCDHVHRVVQQFEHQVATLPLAATDLLHI